MNAVQDEHTTRVTDGGFVICVCGWATAAPDRDPEEAASTHIETTTPDGWVARWKVRAGGKVCIPVPAGEAVPVGVAEEVVGVAPGTPSEATND